jgi:NADPH:quinone reductase-like Zn-dependent oxidoreductase
VLVRVAAASVNPIDYKRRAGLTKERDICLTQVAPTGCGLVLALIPG